ncbi:hypothetical protein IK110_03790 [Candidatus Saccharibacteria bacterium]|nr:hypothetical protein [Candidatus Saccharibacteria bacterium]
MDQNSTMGGFAPTSGPDNGANSAGAMPNSFQTVAANTFEAPTAPTNNFSTNPNPAPAMPAMAAAPQMPAMQPMAAAPAPMAPAPAAGMQDNKKALIETIILVVVCLIAAVAIIFAVVFFMKFRELEENYDSQKGAEIAAAVKAQEDADIENFKEQSKLPYSKFTGPSDYGSLSFEYPKTWNVYIASDGSNNSDYEAYFRPNAVVSTDNDASRYSLRFQIQNRQITSIQPDYDSKVKDGEMTSSVFSAGSGSTALTGMRYEGNITDTIRGVVILIKINDKTAIFQTDASTYRTDFDKVVSSLRRNS